MQNANPPWDDCLTQAEFGNTIDSNEGGVMVMLTAGTEEFEGGAVALVAGTVGTEGKAGALVTGMVETNGGAVPPVVLLW